MKTYLITGGAGFIGSNVARAIAEQDSNNKIIICDYFGKDGKWRNLSGNLADDYISPSEIFYWLDDNADSLEAIIHMGAISATTETDVDYLMENNFSFSKSLYLWCVENNTPLIYASSAATYGDGNQGFDDDESPEYLRKLRPLNGYGWSKHNFDYYVAREKNKQEKPFPQIVGLKFFNVYGVNEKHKGSQKSVISHIVPEILAGNMVKLFKSENPNYADGEQLRDFIYVKDCASVILWLLDNSNISGLFNVGTGKARSFYDLAKASFFACDKSKNIKFVDMPSAIANKYQYYTCANISKLRKAGYMEDFYSLEDGIKDYVQNYLLNS